MNETTNYIGHIVRVSRGPIDHYGIIGPNGLIWEHAGKDTEGIRCVSLAEFSRGTLVQVLADRNLLIPVEQAVERFKTTTTRAFHLLFANCEHRARWAVLGKWSSTQVAAVAGCTAAGAAIGALSYDSDDPNDRINAAVKGAIIGAAAPLVGQYIKTLLTPAADSPNAYGTGGQVVPTP